MKSEIMKIPIDMIKRVIDNFNTRVRAVPDLILCPSSFSPAWCLERTYYQQLKNRKVISFHVLSELEDIISLHDGSIWRKKFHDMLFE